MQSSAAVVCRLLVMLGCLIAVPLMAISGSSLPQLAKALFQGGWGANSASARESLPKAPRFGMQPEMAGSCGASGSMEAFARAAGPISGVPAGVIQTHFQLPLGSDALVRGLRASTGHRKDETIGRQTESRCRLAEMSPVGPDADRPTPIFATASAEAATGRSGPDPGDGRFRAIQERLHELGATYYLLESWGDQRQLYRFHCKMAIGDNPNWNRYFEATDAEPLRAMARALGEVEAWRAEQP